MFHSPSGETLRRSTSEPQVHQTSLLSLLEPCSGLCFVPSALSLLLCPLCFVPSALFLLLSPLYSFLCSLVLPWFVTQRECGCYPIINFTVSRISWTWCIHCQWASIRQAQHRNNQRIQGTSSFPGDLVFAFCATFCSLHLQDLYLFSCCSYLVPATCIAPCLFFSAHFILHTAFNQQLLRMCFRDLS
jgi:hypothetical protein